MGTASEEKRQRLSEGQRLAMRDVKNSWQGTLGLLKEMAKEVKLIPFLLDTAEMMIMDLQQFIKRNEAK